MATNMSKTGGGGLGDGIDYSIPRIGGGKSIGQVEVEQTGALSARQRIVTRQVFPQPPQSQRSGGYQGGRNGGFSAPPVKVTSKHWCWECVNH